MIRWHTEPGVDSQDVGNHSWGVAVMVHHLYWPKIPPGKVLLEALYHDIGERSVGDITAPAKWRSPELRDVVHEIETAQREYLQVSTEELGLTAREIQMVRAADMMDTVARSYVQRRRGDLDAEDIFSRLLQYYATLSFSGSLGEDVNRIIRQFMNDALTSFQAIGCEIA